MSYSFAEIWSFSEFPSLLSPEDQDFFKKLASLLTDSQAGELLGYFNAFLARNDNSWPVAFEILQKTPVEDDFLKILVQKFHWAKLF